MWIEQEAYDREGLRRAHNLLGVESRERKRTDLGERQSIFGKGVDRSRRGLRSFPPKKAARNNRQKVHSIAKNALAKG